MNNDKKDLPIMVEGIVFKKDNNEYSFLCLKRTQDEGGWWQPLIGHIKTNESIPQALLRELEEETGITTPLDILEDVWHFHWEYKDEMYLEFVFGIEINKNQKVKLNPDEHEEYKWCSLDEAISLFKYDNNKKALLKFKSQFMN